MNKKISRLLSSQIAQNVVGRFLYLTYCLWCKSLRYKEFNRSVIERMAEEGLSAAVCFWHDELFPLSYLRKEEKALAVISQSKDGDLLAAVLERHGLIVVRGSSSRGGVQVLRDILKEMDKGAFVFLAVDGPRGPRRFVKKGALFISKKCGIPIIPVRIRMSRSIKFNSWDKFQLPLPFSKVEVVWGDPYAPFDVDSERVDMDEAVEELKNRLNILG